MKPRVSKLASARGTLSRLRVRLSVSIFCAWASASVRPRLLGAKGSATCHWPTGAERPALKETQCPRTSHRPRTGQPKPSLRSSLKPPACPKLSWVNTAAVKACTRNKSRRGGKPASTARRQTKPSKKTIANKPVRTRNASRNLSANCAVKIRRWLKPLRCWCYEKSSTITGGSTTRTTDGLAGTAVTGELVK